jgi:hypothetical protein
VKHHPKQGMFDFLDFMMGLVIALIMCGLWAVTR